jgi:signal recognition particle receptor subunit beta
MATVNYASREICCKIVYYGAGFCGKTVSLQYIHKSVPEQYRGELISLATEQDRTLFFDFLPLEVGSVGGFDTKFQLYTVPGQVFYNATRKLVLRGVDGIVFVVDSQRTRFRDNLESLDNLKENLADYGYEIGKIPWVIQYNKRDLPDIVPIAELEAEINKDSVASFETVAITGKGVKETLKAIAGKVLSHIGSLAQAQEGFAAPRGAATIPVAGKEETRPVASAAGVASPRVVPEASGGQPGLQVGARFVAPRRLAAGDAARRFGSFSTRQKCDVRWAGIRIGSALLEFNDRSNFDGKGTFQLSGTIRILGLLRKYWLKLLAYRGEEKFFSESGENIYFVFSTAPAGVEPERTPVAVWVKNSREQTFYVRCGGAGGEVLISPQGRRHILKQR